MPVGLGPEVSVVGRPAAAEARWLAQAHQLVSDLYTRSPAIYWTDCLLSAGGAWAMTLVYFRAPAWSIEQLFAFLVASVLFFRAGTFIHEIVHMQPGQMPWFGRIWNLLVGIPLLMPWVMYRNHIEHHSIRYFGTPDDGEYLPLAASPPAETLKYLMQAPLLPLLAVIRFGLLGPLSWCHRGLREWVLTHASSGVTNPHYRRRFPDRDRRHLLIVELLCFAYLATLVALTVLHFITATQLLMAYLLMAWSLGLNWVRNLAAHRYGNRGERLGRIGQFEDSINVTGQGWLTVMMFPVGLRYHALHHLFPSLPYHHLGEAHRRLSAQLPPEASYHIASRDSFFTVVADLWRGARHTPPEHSAMQRWSGRNSRS